MRSLPSNIILIGPTGVGKTEIARRLARLAGAPFIKVEASRFTEVGYVGRDVESMVRELVDAGITLVRAEREDEVYAEAERRAEERLLDLLLPPLAAPAASTVRAGEAERVFVAGPKGGRDQPAARRGPAARAAPAKSSARMLKEGKLEDREVEVEVTPQSYPALEGMQPPQGPEGPDVNWFEMFQEMLPKRKKRRNVRVPEARRILIDEELKQLVDQDDVINEALDRVENHGIIFVDEIDKIAGERSTTGPDISREGVQRDLLPIVEGSTVQTRYGYVRTDHILFIAAGAFHVSKPSDLIPELQGRFPIRVELTPLTRSRLHPDHDRAGERAHAAVSRRWWARAVELEFTEDAIRAIARIAAQDQLPDREHRRAAAADRDGDAAGGHALRSANLPESGSPGRPRRWLDRRGRGPATYIL